jgi:hypothetical protein
VRWLRARVYCEGMSVGLAKLMRSPTTFFIVAWRSRRGGSGMARSSGGRKGVGVLVRGDGVWAGTEREESGPGP